MALPIVTHNVNFDNRNFYCMDNLNVLRGMNSNTVDLIATDPPFNKNRDFHATPDSLAAGSKFTDRWKWERDVHEKWVDLIEDDHPKLHAIINASKDIFGDDIGAFLCWLSVRVLEMHRVLKPTGSLYLHCDHTAAAYLKVMLDAIFGKNNFRNEIVWCYAGGGIPSKDFPRKHDTILRYAKDAKRVTYFPQYKPYGEHNTKGRRATSRGGTRAVEYRKMGTPHNDWWIDIKPLINWAAERTGYPTQKPLALYERIIKASSNEGDLVLDPFAGCATTCVAAERLGRQWVGMDIWEGAPGMVRKRLGDEGLIQAQEQVRELTYAPQRTDTAETAAKPLFLRPERALAKWERLTKREIKVELIIAQADGEYVICAGCGRRLEDAFMHLDHIMPRNDYGRNSIDNRVLLCAPCNSYKGRDLTLSGLVRRNKRERWMRDEQAARASLAAAQNHVEQLRAQG